jgi:hypothetical protein
MLVYLGCIVDRYGTSQNERLGTQGEFITDQEPTGFHRAPIDQGDIAATEIAKYDAVSIQFDLAMSARDGGISDGDITTQATPEHDGARPNHPAFPTAWAGFGSERPCHRATPNANSAGDSERNIHRTRFGAGILCTTFKTTIYPLSIYRHSTRKITLLVL